MAFNQFRILLTILVCFAPFFAYICRLNLSLAMNEMVMVCEEPAIECPLDELDQRIAQPRDMLDFLSLNEEHNFHTLSIHETRRMKRKRQPSGVRKKIINPARGLNLPKSTSFLTIDVSEQASSKKISTNLTKTENPTIKRPQSSKLNWSKDDQNDLLGAFFLGYVLNQVPGGRAADLLGSKAVFLTLGLGSGICSLIFPWVAKSFDHKWWAYLVRFVLGMSQGGMFAGAYVFLCQWLPRSERQAWLPLPATFSRIGTIVMYLVMPLVLVNYDWESVFYLSGASCLVWTGLFWVLAADSPRQSRWISHAELVYIESRMEGQTGKLEGAPSFATSADTSSHIATSAGEDGKGNKKKQLAAASQSSLASLNERLQLELHQGTGSCVELTGGCSGAGVSEAAKAALSWRRVATNKAVLIMTIAMFSAEWCNMLLLVKLPDFLNRVLGMDVAEVGFWSSCLIVVYCVQYPLSGGLAARLENAGLARLSSVRIRKLFELAANLLQALGCFMIALSSEKSVVLAALFVMMFGRATVGGGQCLMPPELSRDYPGTVFAYANSLANLAGVLGPLLIKLLVAEPTSHASWYWVWLVSGGIFVGTGAAFALLADNRPQELCRKTRKEQ